MHPNLCVHSFRPGGILPTSTNVLLDYVLEPIVVRVGMLADAMITAAIDPVWFGRFHCCPTPPLSAWQVLRPGRISRDRA